MSLPTKPQPQWAFELYCTGVGDLACANDRTLVVPRWTRLWWRVRGALLCTLLGRVWRWGYK